MSDADAVPEVRPAPARRSIASSGLSLLSDEGSAPTTDAAVVKATLHRYLQKHRAARCSPSSTASRSGRRGGR